MASTVPEGYKRFSVDVPEALYKALLGAKAVDGIAMSARVNELVQLWVESPKIAAQVNKRAIETRTRHLAG